MNVSDELLREVVDTTPMEVAVIDADGRIVYTNTDWREFGAENGLVGDPAAIGVNYLSVVESARDDEYAREVAAGIRALLDGAQSSFSLEYPCHSPDERRWFTVYAEAFEHGGARYVTLNHVNVTERKLAELRVSDRNERLETVASILSHDLRNPLNVAMGYLDLLRDELPTGSEYLDRIETALGRMDAIIDDALVFARRMTLEDAEPVDIGEVARDVWDALETDRGRLEIASSPTLQSNRGILRHLFENLFRNALEHGAPDGESITVRVGGLDDGFYVEDDGRGIPVEDREQVFESGFTTGDGHSGLGLFIVKEIANAHDWSVSVTESPSGGARFEFRESDGRYGGDPESPGPSSSSPSHSR